MSDGGALPDPLPIEALDAGAGAAMRRIVRVPGSKSLSNRHLILAALSQGVTRLEGLLACDDCDRLLAALEAFGVRHRAEGAALVIERGALPARGAVDLGDGGTPTRFMIAFAAAQEGGEWLIDGSARMRERPVSEGVEMLRALGARIEYAEAEGRLPVRVFGGSLGHGSANRIEVGRTASSQFVSALLLVAPSLPTGLEIVFTEEPTSPSYIELSLEALAAAGIEAQVHYGPTPLSARSIGRGLRSIMVPPQTIAPGVRVIEPDASSAVYPAALAAIAGLEVEIPGLARRSMQPDSAFLDELALRGAGLEVPADGRKSLVVRGRPPLRALDSDYSRMPDAAVMGMVAAACADGPSRFDGLGTLRVKESDRIEAVAAGLRALGGTVETGPDWVRVHPLPPQLAAAAIDTVNDHRIAMAFAVLGLARPGVTIRNPSCVAKSWPGFWDAMIGRTCENRSG